ncbi:MAG TPA: tetratricopeptide repeat protein, partial [Polyangiaceae bacterium]
VDVAVTGASCAMELPKDKIQDYLPALVTELGAIVKDPSLAILPDDRSGAYEALVDAGQATGEKAAVVENATAWATFLEGEAAKAKTPSERAVYDPHRLLAYLAMGQPAKAIPMLEASAKDFPDDFNPHARLAKTYFELKKYDDSIAEADKALALAHGPRRVKIALGKADAQTAKKDKAGAKKTLEDARAFVQSLPPAQASAASKKAIDDKLKKL